MEEEGVPSTSQERGRTLDRRGVKRPKRSSSLFSCFPNKKTIKQWEKEDLLNRVQRNSNRRCFTLPPNAISHRNPTLTLDPDNVSLPPSSIAIADETARRRTWNFSSLAPKILPGRRSNRRQRSQAEANQSFLRAARSGNIGKITEHLNSNVDLNTVSSVSSIFLKIKFMAWESG